MPKVRGGKIHKLILESKPADEIKQEIRSYIKTYNDKKQNKRKVTLDHFVHSDNCLLMRCCAKYNQKEMLIFFIEEGANINAVNSQALIEACRHGFFDIVQCLLEYGAKVHTLSNEAIHSICSKTDDKSNYEQIRKILLYYGAVPHRIPFSNDMLHKLNYMEHNLYNCMRERHEQYLMYCEEFHLNIPECLYK